MEGNALVVDISSDEVEAKSLEKKKEGGEKFVVEYDRINYFFDVSNKEEEQGKEVVVVDEVKKKDKDAKLSSKFSSIISTKPVKDEGEDEDDDCVILDSDQEKIDNSVVQAPSGSDELLVVGEKGQIACRDLPHPRHL